MIVTVFSSLHFKQIKFYYANDDADDLFDGNGIEKTDSLVY